MTLPVYNDLKEHDSSEFRKQLDKGALLDENPEERFLLIVFME